MTRTRKTLAWAGGIFVLLVAVLVVILATFDWNRIKPTINSKVSEILHRPFAINGDLAVRWQREEDQGGWRAWVPWPHVIAQDLTLGNPEWAKTAQMASLKRVELRLSPLALLTQTVDIPRINLTEPSASLERLADGRANWTFTFDPKDPDAEPSAWTLDIGAIGFDKGHVTLNDQTLKTRLDVLIDSLGKPIPFSEIVGEKDAKKALEKGGKPQDYAFALKVKGQYHGQQLNGSGKIGGLLALQDATQPFPLQARVSIADSHVELAGTLTDPLNLGALDLRLKLAGTSLSNLYPLTGVTLPDSPPYSTDGHLTAKLREANGATFSSENFNTTCVACHGPQGHGVEAMGAPNLTEPAGFIYGTSLAQLQQTIRHGRQGQMPAQDVLQGNDKVHLLAAYVYSLSHNAEGATPDSATE